MDIDEFVKKVKPNAKKSQMEPFRVQIFELKSKGYADDQVKDWLALNGLVVSRQAVQQFVKKGMKTIIESADKNPQATTELVEKDVNTPLPRTGFHEVVATLKAQNSNSDPRRNN